MCRVMIREVVSDVSTESRTVRLAPSTHAGEPSRPLRPPVFGVPIELGADRPMSRCLDEGGEFRSR